VGEWWFMAFAKLLDEALDLWYRLSEDGARTNVELWEMEPRRYGNRYVVICREKQRGPTPKIRLLRKIKP